MLQRTPRPIFRGIVRLAAALLGLGFVHNIFSAVSSPELYRDPSASAATRVEDLLGRMTLDEKLSMLSGVDGFYLRGVERLGLPRMKMGDGPVGVRNWGPSTLYPATMLLAATWDESLATRFGTALGNDSRARGMHLSLAPGVNIYRSPLGGRNYEYMGEDPFLTSRMAVASIRAVQARGVAATVKHFAANNSETRRSYINNVVDERTLREIYLPAFRAAVQTGGVDCIMDAYNLINGDYCTANLWLNQTVLREEWGFRGVVMSDWNATHDTQKAALGGLDLEMPVPTYFTPAKLKPLVENGTVPQTIIDEKVRRLLRLVITHGWLDHAQDEKSIALDDPASAATALEIARRGITLLKNENGTLPLDPAKLKTIVVLGPNATRVITGLGSGKVQPFHSVSFLEGLRAKLGSARVLSIPWTEPLDLLESSVYAQPLKLEIYPSRRAKKPVAVETPKKMSVGWDKKNPSYGLTAQDLLFARWTGAVAPGKTGDYQFVIQAQDAGVRVWVDGVIRWDSLREATGSFVLHLEGGTAHPFKVEAEQRKKAISCAIALGWGAVSPIVPADQIAAVRHADAALLCVGFNSILGEGEGADRSYALPGRQEELIRTVGEMNSHTVVALNAGGSVATANWIKQVPAFLHTFYAGQEGGTALAEILLGETNPSGRLPFSYEQRWEDCAAYGNYPEDSLDESVTTINYREGIFVGYRWFDHKNIAPLFPFGYGLSYTTFSIDDLKVEQRGADLIVTANVANTGTRVGRETAQLYVGQINCSVPRPVRELKDFANVTLQPGESRTVEFHLSREAFAFFHPVRLDWTVEPGSFVVTVGASSRDLRQQQTITYGQ